LSAVGLDRVLIVNTADRGGGAERVSMDLLDGFAGLGTEAWLAVGVQHTDDPRVIPVHRAARAGPGARARRRAVETRRRIDRGLGLEDLAHWSTRDLLELTGAPPDLVVCNNLHGGYFDLGELPRLSRRLPVVVRLADSWMFTGHCAVPPGCSRWEHGCGSCPDLATPPAVRHDLTAHNWRRKQRILAGARLHVATPSRWLADRARRSLLAPAIASSRVVPNGIDLAAFMPGPKAPARAELGLDPDAAVLVFVSNLGAANPHKDFPTLRRMLDRLAGRGLGRPLELVVAGAGAPDETPASGVRIRHLPYIDSDDRLAALYRAADLYVHAAPAEAFCLAAAEALACGTPVVAAAAGGLAEVVEHERTGLVVAPGDDAGAAGAVTALLAEPDRRARMGALAAHTARARFGRDRAVGDLHAWCAELVAARSGDAVEDERPSPSSVAA
jgi:glycosyltransferase involved in cell wall biosynthesis